MHGTMNIKFGFTCLKEVISLLILLVNHNLLFFSPDKSDSDSEGQWQPVNEDDL